MSRSRTRIFALDMPERETLAFEAKTDLDAKVLVHERWFVTALDEVCIRKRILCNTFALQPRLATAAEAALFSEQVAEFPEVLNCVLVVLLSSL